METSHGDPALVRDCDGTLQLLDTGKASSRELVEDQLDRIATLDTEIRAVVTWTRTRPAGSRRAGR